MPPIHDFVIRADQAAGLEQCLSHRWNPRSRVHVAFLGRALGLQRTGLNLARVPPGHESFLPHAHACEEEWLYILDGRAIVEIDGQDVEVAAGDFIAFPAPSVVHHLRNPFAAEVVYLMGGERRELEIEDFPSVGKRMIRRGEAVEVYDLDAARPFGEVEPASTS